MAYETRPYGSWTSPLRAGDLAAGSLRLSQTRVSQGRVYWLEGRPAEGGRQVVVCEDGAGGVEEVTPEDVNVRNRVHEYGGGDFAVWGGEVFYASFADGSVWQTASGGSSRQILPGGAARADFERSPDGQWLVCVEEQARAGEEPANRMLAVPLAAPNEVRCFAEDFDFVSSPRFSLDGTRLAYISWCHPDMPWDATRLHEVAWGAAGPERERAWLSGDEESVVQPGWSPEGALTFVSDRSGFWNLERLVEGGRQPLCARPAEFAGPQWTLAPASWAYVDADSILCTYASEGRGRLARLRLSDGTLEDLALPFEHFDALRVEGALACFVGSGPSRPSSVVRLDLRSGAFEVLRESSHLEVSDAWVSVPEAIRFGSGDEEAHAFLYRPRHPELAGPAAARPPLLVKSHGGPTGATAPVLDPRIQFWTSRGVAVVDVNYRGSTGYGRAYRNRLRGQWGVFDVDDCVAAARHLCEEGLADPERLAISGGSAGGYTTLCALTFRDTFRAGASHYGIGDLETLVRDTHKFESRYCDRLIGPYPERRDLYRERSPLHAASRLSCPVAFFQGLDDRVVPPNQAEAMVGALEAQGIPHAYVAFEGEQHGFRRAENVAAALEGELSFYGQVFGFAPDIDGGPIALRA